MTNANDRNQDGKRSINEGYQPSVKGYKPNNDDTFRPGHTPKSSESKPKNPPKKR